MSGGCYCIGLVELSQAGFGRESRVAGLRVNVNTPERRY